MQLKQRKTKHVHHLDLEHCFKMSPFLLANIGFVAVDNEPLKARYSGLPPTMIILGFLICRQASPSICHSMNQDMIFLRQRGIGFWNLFWNLRTFTTGILFQHRKPNGYILQPCRAWVGKFNFFLSDACSLLDRKKRAIVALFNLRGCCRESEQTHRVENRGSDGRPRPHFCSRSPFGHLWSTGGRETLIFVSQTRLLIKREHKASGFHTCFLIIFTVLFFLSKSQSQAENWLQSFPTYPDT